MTAELVVLIVGLLGGAALAVKTVRASEATGAADLELRIADATARRDELFERLRDSKEDLSPADRESLETAAARVLKQLDDLEASQGKKKRRPASSGPSGRRESRGQPMLVGVAVGAGTVGLLAALVFWADQDAQPDPSQPQGTAESSDATVPEQPPLPPFVAGEVDRLSGLLAEDPDDLAARKQLADLLLGVGRFFDAYQEAQEILARAPEDDVGNYVQGVVRYTMGQPEIALAQLEQSLTTNPRLTQASVMHGIVLLATGDREAAIRSWEAGLEAAGGSQPRLEHLLGLARGGSSVEEILRSPPP